MNAIEVHVFPFKECNSECNRSIVNIDKNRIDE